MIESEAPPRQASEFRRQSRLVTRKMALRICGPAIITNAIGNIFTRFIGSGPFAIASSGEPTLSAPPAAAPCAPGAL